MWKRVFDYRDFDGVDCLWELSRIGIDYHRLTDQEEGYVSNFRLHARAEGIPGFELSHALESTQTMILKKIEGMLHISDEFK